MRAIPRYVQQATTDDVHRIVDSEGGLIESYVPGQAARLLAEAIQVEADESLFGMRFPR